MKARLARRQISALLFYRAAAKVRNTLLPITLVFPVAPSSLFLFPPKENG
jgi:hypothetical protein